MIVTVVTPALKGMRWLANCTDSAQLQASPGVDIEHIVGGMPPTRGGRR
jgi:hypothetical protein